MGAEGDIMVGLNALCRASADTDDVVDIFCCAARIAYCAFADTDITEIAGVVGAFSCLLADKHIGAASSVGVPAQRGSVFACGFGAITQCGGSVGGAGVCANGNRAVIGCLRVVTGGDGVFCAGNRAHARGQGIAARCAVVVVVAATGTAVIDAVVVRLRFFGDGIKLAAVNRIGAGGAHFARRDVFQLPLVACCAKGNDVARQRLAAARPVIGDAIDGCGFLFRSRFQGFGAAADGNGVVERGLRAGTNGDAVGVSRPRFGTERNAQICRLRLHAHCNRRLFGYGFGINIGSHRGVAGQGLISLPYRAIDLIATIGVGIGSLLTPCLIQVIATDGD